MDDPEKVAERRRKGRERQRRYRERKRQERARDAVVTELRPAAEPDADSPTTVAAVQAELDRLPEAARRPGVAAAALRMAALLDDPTAAPQAPSAARTLFEALRVLREGGASRPGKLAELRTLHARGGDRGA